MRRWLLLLVIIFSLVGIASCSSSGGRVKAIEPEALPELNAKLKVKKRWSQTVGAGFGKYYQLITPAVSGDRVFASDNKGKVYAFDRIDGNPLWSVDVAEQISGGVGAFANLVVVGTLKGEIIALDQADGSERWRAFVSSEVLAPPQSNSRVVVVQTTDGKLYGFDISNGRQLWLYTSSLPVLTLRGTATPLVTSTTVIAGFANGKVVALAMADGSFLWQQRIARPQGRTELERLVDIDGMPVLQNDTVYVCSYQGNLSALSRTNGRIRWMQKNSSYQGPAVFGDKVFAVTDEGMIRAFNNKTGSLLWENSQLLRRRLSAPQQLAGFLAVADYEGYVHIVDPEAGIILARIRVDSDGVRSPMVADGSYLYILGNDGELAAISVHLLTE